MIQARIRQLEATAGPHVNGFPRYSAEEIARRHAFLRHALDEQDLACVIVGGRGLVDSPLQYFTNWPCRQPCYLLVGADGQRELIARLWNHLPNAQEIAVVDRLVYGGDTHGELLDKVAEGIRRRAGRHRRVGLVGELAYWDVQTWSQTLPELELVDLNPAFRALRRAKTAEELAYVRVAAACCDAALEALRDQVAPGLEERHLQAVIEGAFLGTGAQPAVSFALSTWMSEPGVCVPRQILSDRRLQAGDVIVTEITAVYWGYSSQILRTLTVGADPTELYRQLHEVALDRYRAIAGVCRPGSTVGEILDLAEPIHEAGLSIWDDLFHGFGGGGYFSPVLRTRQTGGADTLETVQLEEGWVVVAQPNVITADARAGVQVGNALVVTPAGGSCLQEFPTRLVRCG